MLYQWRELWILLHDAENPEADDCAEIQLNNNPAEKSGVAAVPGLVGP